MIAAVTLLSYSILLATLVPRLLRAAAWVDRAPRLGIVVWQAASVSVLASVTMAGLALTVPAPAVSGGLADWLSACVLALREQYSTPGGAAAGATGAVLALAAIGRVGWCLMTGVRRMMQEREGHRRILDVVGRRDKERGIVVLDSNERAVYCLPGRQRRTVVTTGALLALDDQQLKAVLAHERAHLAERHDLVLAFSSALAAAFPVVPLFRHGESEAKRLVELRADDVASARTDRLTLAAALLSVVSGRASTAAPAAAMALAGSGGAERVRRLLPPHNPLRRVRAVAASVAVVAGLLLPVFILASPAAVAAQHHVCPTTAAESGTAA